DHECNEDDDDDKDSHTAHYTGAFLCIACGFSLTMQPPGPSILSMANHAVRVDSLRVKRGKHEVLHGLDLSIDRGGLVGLLGPSGSGKTTLMRSIVGVQQTAAGTVEVLGHPAGSAALRDRVGYVTQSASVYDDLTVRQNLRY